MFFLTPPLIVEEYIEKLKFLFSENLLLAALDLVDRECGKAFFE